MEVNHTKIIPIEIASIKISNVIHPITAYRGHLKFFSYKLFYKNKIYRNKSQYKMIDSYRDESHCRIDTALM